MLVLSRRAGERLLFPGMQTAVRVLCIRPGVVRLGIEAPPEVTVLRDEIPDRVAEWAGVSPAAENPPRIAESSAGAEDTQWSLKEVSMSLGLARLQLQTGDAIEAGRMLATIHRQVQSLRGCQEREEKEPHGRPSRAKMTRQREDGLELLAGCMG
jgi:carbon storage regulator CsrA